VLRILGCFLSSDGCDIRRQHRRGPGHHPAGFHQVGAAQSGGYTRGFATCEPVTLRSAAAVFAPLARTGNASSASPGGPGDALLAEAMASTSCLVKRVSGHGGRISGSGGGR
jgi:hypothetical protein